MYLKAALSMRIRTVRTVTTRRNTRTIATEIPTTDGTKLRAATWDKTLEARLRTEAAAYLWVECTFASTTSCFRSASNNTAVLADDSPLLCDVVAL
jgi:hypothetical protein